MIAWTDSDGEVREFEDAPEGAPFRGYMAFRGGPGDSGVTLVDGDEPIPPAIMATVSDEGWDGGVIRLAFEGRSEFVTLTNQAEVVLEEIAQSMTCAIRIATPTGTSEYKVPAIALPDSATARAAILASLLKDMR